MLRPRWHKVVDDLWNNKARTLLVVIAVATGVFTFGVVGISHAILKDELNTVYRATNPASIQMVVSPFGDDLIHAVEGMRQVEQAEARAYTSVRLRIQDDEWITMDLYAIDDFEALELSTFQIEAGAWPDRREIMVERTMLKIPGFNPAIGDSITIELKDGREQDLVLGGVAHDVVQFPSHYFRVGVGYISLDTYQWLTGSRLYNRLYIQAAGDTSDKAFVDSQSVLIKNRIEDYGYTVYSTEVPEPGEHWNAYSYDALTAILSVLGVFSLLLSLFMIVNTMSAILKQQVRQIGVIKAVGGRLNQIMLIYLAMALAFGLLALLIAHPAARIVARAFVDFAASLTNFDVQHFAVSPWVFILQAGLAIVLPLLAAVFPVAAGARITAREALSDYGLRTAGSGDFFDRLVGQIRGLPRPMLLSLRNTFRRKGRLALTLLTLMVAGSVFISIFSLRESLSAKIDELFSLFSYDFAIGLSEPAARQMVEREAGRIPGVVHAEGWLSQDANYIRSDGTEGVSLTVFGVPPDSAFVSRVLVDGRWFDEADSHAIIVQGNLLNMEPEVKLGDQILLDFGEKEETWQVVGIMSGAQNTDYNAGLAYVSQADLERVMNLPGMATFVTVGTVQHDAGTQNRTLREVEDRYQRAGINTASSQTAAQLFGGANIAIGVLMSLLLSMAVLLAFVGGLGLAGTMSLNVIERTREIGVMRAIGATNRMIFSVVIAEGVVIGLLSAFFGALLAVPLSALLAVMIGQVMIQAPLKFAYSLPGLGMWLVLSIIVSAVASSLPAWSAVQTSVQEALAYE